MDGERMNPEDRLRRFWMAHGRSTGQLTVLSALCINPGVAWTPEQLCEWYGFKIGRAREILAEFSRCGVVRKLEGSEEKYVLDPRVTWAVHANRAKRPFVRSLVLNHTRPRVS